MPELRFSVDGARPMVQAASPYLVFSLHLYDISNMSDRNIIYSVMLQCQIRIEPARRAYSDKEQAALLELFGEPARWSQTLKSLLWTQCTITVPAFSGETVLELPVQCSFDFNIAAIKYFYAVQGGEMPLSLLFNGTIFYNDDGAVRIAPIAWDNEVAFQLPAQLWKQTMDLHYANVVWITLRKDIFDRLYHYKTSHTLATWEQAFDSLLSGAEEQPVR